MQTVLITHLMVPPRWRIETPCLLHFTLSRLSCFGLPHLGKVLIQGGIKRWEVQQVLPSMLRQLQRLKPLQGSRSLCLTRCSSASLPSRAPLAADIRPDNVSRAANQAVSSLHVS